MNLSRIDLNLLVVFHHLLALKRVSAVATVLGMSQPAVSSALRRLRETLGDELFLRTHQGMAPTPYATQLAQPVAVALDSLQQGLAARATFNPLQSTRNFAIAMTDVGEMYFLPILINALSHSAPRVTVNIVSVAPPSLKEDMSGGRIDLAVGLLPQLQAGFYQQVLFRQRYVCLMRSAHPLASTKVFKLEDFTSAKHAKVISVGTGHGRVDIDLEKRGLLRHIILTVPHYVAMGDVLASSDLIATVPERFADRISQPYNLVKRTLPFEIGASAIHQFWHARLHKDAGHQWLRMQIRDLFADENHLEEQPV